MWVHVWGFRVVAARKSIFSMDMQWPLIATGCANGEVRVWDMQRLQLPTPVPGKSAGTALMSCIAVALCMKICMFDIHMRWGAR